jgi:Adenylate and Guanylate cyclase catalytic domain
MESTGISGRIQVTQKTADQLISAGKEGWLTKHSDTVEVKGKGAMTKYWFSPSGKEAMSVTIGQSGGREKDTNTLILQRETNNQLVAWNVGVFTELLKNVVAARTPTTSNYLSDSNNNVGDQMINCHPIDEISATRHWNEEFQASRRGGDTTKWVHHADFSVVQV